MLCLSRKVNERILIGDDIKITIIRIGPNTVRIGIEAPGSLNVLREELINVDGGDSAGERVLSAARLGGGLGVEIADVEGGV